MDNFKYLAEYTVQKNTSDNSNFEEYFNKYKKKLDEVGEEDEPQGDLPVSTDVTPDDPEATSVSNEPSDEVGEAPMVTNDVDSEVPPSGLETPSDVPDSEQELDITDLVNSMDQSKDMVTQNSNLLNNIMNTINNLENKLGNIGSIESKIDNLERELEKRVPTKIEKMEMVSAKGYPFTQSVDEYFADKKDRYEIVDINTKQIPGNVDTQDIEIPKQEEEQEFKMKLRDIFSQYNENEVGKNM